MKYLYWFVAAPLMVFAVLFAISNRGPVELELLPIPGSVTVPIFVLALGVLAIGFFSGGFISWINAGKTRSRARIAERKAREEEREITDLKHKLEQAKTTKLPPAEPHTLLAVDPK
jgi:uncharacterized integral membrane protein